MPKASKGGQGEARLASANTCVDLHVLYRQVQAVVGCWLLAVGFKVQSYAKKRVGRYMYPGRSSLGRL